MSDYEIWSAQINEGDLPEEQIWGHGVTETGAIDEAVVVLTEGDFEPGVYPVVLYADADWEVDDTEEYGQAVLVRWSSRRRIRVRVDDSGDWEIEGDSP